MSRPSSALRHFLAGRSVSARRRLRDAGEQGFTLIELAIVLVILPLVIGGIAIALIAILQDQTGISTRVSDSVDSQVTSTFFVRDAESAQYVTTTRTPGATPWTSAFGPATCGTGRSFVVGLAWSTGSGLSPEAVVSYWSTQRATGSGSVSGATLTATSAIFSRSLIGQGVVQTTGGTTIPPGTTIKNIVSPTQATLSNPATGGPLTFAVDPQLIRDFCEGSASPSSVTTSRDFFSPFTEAVISCVKGHTSPTCVTTVGNDQTAAHVWAPTYAVSSVTLAVAEPAGKYDYYVSGTPQLSNAKGNALGTCNGEVVCYPKSFPTLLLLGGFNVITEESGHAKITVVGTAVLNTGYFRMKSTSTFTVLTKPPTTHTPTRHTPTAGKIESSLTPPTGVCTVSGAKCSSPPTATITPWAPPNEPVHIPAPIRDPLTGITDPGPEAVPAICTPPGHVISITSSVTLTPGQYKCPLHVKSGGVVTLKRGLYEFDTGITLTGHAVLNGTRHVLIYLPCNQPGPTHHLDTWATSCTEQVKVKNSTITAQGFATSVGTGTYGGLWFWENEGDTAPYTLSGNTNVMMVHGVMYSPGAPVTLTGLGTSTTPIGSIITSHLTVSNSSIVITGLK